MSTEMKTGLVLSGGGAVGAYQAGVVKALAECGVQISMVSGAYRCMESINEKLGTNLNINWYQKAGITDSPASHSERYSIIVALLDYINIETNQAPLMRQWLYEMACILDGK